MKWLYRIVVIVVAAIAIPLWINYGAWIGLKMEFERVTEIWE